MATADPPNHYKTERPVLVEELVRIQRVRELINLVAAFPQKTVQYWVEEGILRPKKNGHFRFDENELLFALLTAKLSAFGLKGVGLTQALLSFRARCAQMVGDHPLRRALRIACGENGPWPVMALVELEAVIRTTEKGLPKVSPLYSVITDIGETIGANELQKVSTFRVVLQIPLVPVVEPLAALKWGRDG
jgi:hypothetical protein